MVHFFIDPLLQFCLRRAGIVTIFCIFITSFSASALPDYVIDQGPIDGDLSIELIGAPNLAVDSNDPLSGPRSAYIGVKICNTGANNITDLAVNVGDFTSNTPGLYPSRTVTESTYSGTFLFEHVGDCDEYDSIREMDVLEAGECYVQYWMIEYPIQDASGNSVAGSNTLDDDLYLEFDVWVTADDAGISLTVDDTHRSYMRSMLSAAANKAWPNGTGKVPEEYLQIFEDSLGWRPDTTNQIAGCLFTLEGIWYDLGRINKGFDNDGDLVPDYNVFMQPVGNPFTFDNCCFRLIKSYGVIIVKLSGGGEKVITFEDEFYQTNLPPDNTGGVGLIFYQYVPLSAPCAGLITPYQNVASGSNNEKYSGDFGITLGGPTSEIPPATLEKSGPGTSSYDTDIPFSITITNNQNKSLGIAQYFENLTIRDSIPEGTVYVAGSADAFNVLPPGVTVSTQFSTDGGFTYTDTEPLASSVSDVAWIFEQNLPTALSATVTLELRAPSATYTSPYVINEAGATFGSGDPFLTDVDTVLLLGIQNISGTVFSDDGGTTGILGNGIQEGDESGINNVTLTLYFDVNQNGQVDGTDFTIGEQVSSVGGAYTFASLPDGNFIVVVDNDDLDIPAGSGLSTGDVFQLVAISGGDVTGIDFGYTPALKIEKYVSSVGPYYEGREVTFDIKITNLISSTILTSDTLTIRDEFSAYSYSNNDGTANWSSDWLESEANGPSAGSININNPAQRLVVGGGSVERSADLSGANVAILSFIHRTQSGTGTIDLQVSNDEGSMWNTITTFSMGSDDSFGTSDTYDISSYISSTADVSIRFLHSGGTGIKSFDDIQIEYYNGSGGGKNCNVHDLYISYDESGQYSPTANLIGPPDDNYASAFWGNFIEGEGFSLPVDTSSTITKVEMVAKVYHTGTVINDVWRGIYRFNGSGSGNIIIDKTSAETQAFEGISNAGELSFDITSEQSSWIWSDFNSTANIGHGIFIQSLQVSSDDGAIPYVDAVWFRLTTDEVCSGGNNNLTYNNLTSLNPLPLIDMYNPDSLEFVTADIYPDSIDAINGKLYWDDLGPLNAGNSKVVTVTFEAQEPPPNNTGYATNMGIVNAATFGNQTPANTDTATAQILIQPAGSISGYVWSDANGNGWAGTVGYASPEQFIPDATIILHSCTNVANNGSCNGIELTYTTATDENGFYIFEGLESNLHYYVELVESSLPGFVNQTGDPDDDPNRGSGNGGTCGSGGANARCDASWDNDGNWFEIGIDFWGVESWDITEINFGYEVDPIAFGVVWEDVNGNGIRELSEPGISGVTMEFQTSACTPGVNCPTEVTDVNGEYTFSSLSTGNNNVMTVITSTLPAGNIWTQTYESDASLDNDIDVDIGSGDISGSHDFGFYPVGTGQIGDKVYFDNDADGVQDSGEEGMIGIPLTLYRDLNDNNLYDSGIDLEIATTTTDGTGTYSFASLATGEYIVVVDETALSFPTIVTISADPDEAGTCSICDGTGAVSISSNLDNSIDFGYFPLGDAVIGDLVWRDLNGDQSVSSIIETGLSSITVSLDVDFNEDGTYVNYSFSITNSEGAYTFDDLPDGRYIIRVNTADSDIPRDSYGESMIPTTSTSDTIIIAGGLVTSINGGTCSSCNLDFDFGFAFPGAIGDLIFYDNNADATLDATEEGISGVTVYLCNENEASCNVATALLSTVSDANGNYIFTGLPEATYKIAIDESTLPSGITSANQTGDPDRDGVACDDNTYPSLPPCDNEALNLDIYYGTRQLGVDFSYLPPGVIGDLVWLDIDGDGNVDSGEPGLAEVDVSLTPPAGIDLGAGNGISIGVETDQSGFYSFGALPDGTYTLAITPPVGYQSVYEVDGTYDNQVTIIISGGEVSTSNSWCSKIEGCSLDLDFGYDLNGSYDLSGIICIDDISEDGVCNTGGEAFQVGVELFLFTASGTYLGSAFTDSVGAYTFSGLPDDTYNISMSIQESPFTYMSFTTTVFTTPATSITETGTSIFQTLNLNGASIGGVDFAFKYDGDLDFGDLPAPYPTSIGDSPEGAYHILNTTPTLFFGSLVDSETNPILTEASTGDDLDNTPDDEDGILPIIPNQWVTGTNGGEISITVAEDGWVVAFMDFNSDGDFTDSEEMVVNQFIAAGTSIIPINITASLDANTNTLIYSRFRLFEVAPSIPELAYTGVALNGEVEDHLIKVIKKRRITTNMFIPYKLRNKSRQ